MLLCSEYHPTHAITAALYKHMHSMQSFIRESHMAYIFQNVEYERTRNTESNNAMHLTFPMWQMNRKQVIFDSLLD